MTGKLVEFSLVLWELAPVLLDVILPEYFSGFYVDNISDVFTSKILVYFLFHFSLKCLLIILKRFCVVNFFSEKT